MKTKKAMQAYHCDGCHDDIAKGNRYARSSRVLGSSKSDTMEMRNGQPVFIMHGVSVDLFFCEACAASPPHLDLAEALKARPVECACRAWGHDRDCDWRGLKSETVTIEYMPEWMRASHAAARNSGVYPHNGANRVRVSPSCADEIVASDPEWARKVLP